MASQDLIEEIQQRYNAEVMAAVQKHREGLVKLQETVDGLLKVFVDTFGEVSDLKEISQQTLKGLEDELKDKIEKGITPIVFFGLVGPGGAGKDTVLENARTLLENNGNTTSMVVYCTTREQRAYEENGVHYNFMSVDKMESDLKSLELSEGLKKDLSDKLGVNLENIENLTPEILNDIEKVIIEKGLAGYPFQIDLSNTPVENGHILSLTYKSGRGWYMITSDDVLKKIEGNRMVGIIEDPLNLHRVAEWLSKGREDIVSRVVCVVPPQPFIGHMAARALNRDGLDLSWDKLASTVGDRQIGLLEDVFTQIPAKDLVLLVNDEFNDGMTVAGQQLGEVLNENLK
jgi:hypothetical protein